MAEPENIDKGAQTSESDDSDLHHLKRPFFSLGNYCLHSGLKGLCVFLGC
jgi:hypothetical protein